MYQIKIIKENKINARNINREKENVSDKQK